MNLFAGLRHSEVAMCEGAVYNGCLSTAVALANKHVETTKDNSAEKGNAIENVR